MREINRIVIHCSATPPDMDIGVDEIRGWHTSPPRRWRDVGYHWVIRRGGKIEQGRHWRLIGAHVKGHNRDSIGVCLVGGVDEKDKPENNFTTQQWKALRQVCETILLMFPGAVISGHNHLDSKKACPSFDTAKWVVKEWAL